MKKLFVAMAAMAMMFTGCGEAPAATLTPEGTENTIVENVIVENTMVDGKLKWEEAKELYYHPYWEDMSNEALHHEWWCEYKDFNEESYTEQQIWEIRFMLDELGNRVEEDGWVYDIDIDDEHFTEFKALVETKPLMSKEFITTLEWNLHDIYEYGNSLR